MLDTAPSRQLNYPIEPYPLMYTGIRDQRYRIPAVPFQDMKPDYLRQIVHDPTTQPVGTIVIDLRKHYLYLVLPDRKAMRYGIAIGPAISSWPGPCRIKYRKAWPIWYPSKKDLLQDQSLLIWKKKGRPPGIYNPYGARALFVYQGSIDTHVVIHGTREWNHIGGSIDYGSIALMNQDIVDLYERTKTGARVIVVS